MTEYAREKYESNKLSAAQYIAQRKPNKTGLPDPLKSGIESLSGHSMDDVKVNYNSSKPAQLNAHAFAQGNQIHLGPGQEKHLPHEAWHVVQQKQGRVRPTIQLKGGFLFESISKLAIVAEAGILITAGGVSIATLKPNLMFAGLFQIAGGLIKIVRGLGVEGERDEFKMLAEATMGLLAAGVTMNLYTAIQNLIKAIRAVLSLIKESTTGHVASLVVHLFSVALHAAETVFGYLSAENLRSSSEHVGRAMHAASGIQSVRVIDKVAASEIKPNYSIWDSLKKKIVG